MEVVSPATDRPALTNVEQDPVRRRATAATPVDRTGVHAVWRDGIVREYVTDHQSARFCAAVLGVDVEAARDRDQCNESTTARECEQASDKTIDLDQPRGMVAQMSADLRRLLGMVGAPA